jgi:type IV pilus assembly protein PilB
MNIEPFLIASTVRVVVGQRLVRRLCVDCKESYAPDGAELQHLQKVFHLDGAMNIKHVNELEQQALEGGIGKLSATSKNDKEKQSAELSTSSTTIKRLWKAHEDGCTSCNHSGYKGRIGVYEVLHNSDAIQKLIVTNGTSEAIEDVAIQEGMLTMQLDGFIKALRGETSIEEILRATAED